MNRKLFLILAGMLSSVTLLQAATNYVATTGNDTNSGSFASPFLTIQKAVDVAPTGSVIWVGPGTYSSGQNSSIPAAGKSRLVITKNVTVRSLQGAQQTIILGQKNTESIPYGVNSVRCVFMTEGVLDGFTLKTGYTDTTQSNGNMDNPIINGGGVCVPVGYTNPVINNCIITDCSAYRGAAAYHGTLNNCTLVSNKSAAVNGGGCVWSATVNNSIVRFNDPDDFSVDALTTDTSLFSYCCLSSLPGKNRDNLVRNVAGNITDDPAFQTGTFIPARGSPCINKGSNAYSNGTLDAAGLARVQNSIVDIGAYEVSFLPYILTVVNGQGSGTYTNGDIVSISTSNTLSQWVTFTGWTGDTNTIADITASATTITMPARATTVTANYVVGSPIDGIISEALEIPLPIATSNVTVFSVNPAVPSVTLGGIADGNVASFATVYTNAGTVTFSWNVSSEADCDFLSFYVDGALQTRISGEVSGVVTQFVAGIGAHALKWEYSKDASEWTGADQGKVGPILWIPNDLSSELGVAGPLPPPSFPLGQPGEKLPFPYGFQACYLDSSAPTGAVSGSAVKLGGLLNGVPLVPDSQATGVEVVLNGAATLAFRVKTGCQSDDKIVCSVDGTQQFSMFGNKNADWTNVVITVAGTSAHVVRWSYIKSSGGLGLQDAVWIDNVTWTRQTCTLTVQDGSGSGPYFVGDTATIVATNVTASQVFEKWTGDVAQVANVNSMTTTVYMASDTVVSANYKVMYALSVTAGTGSGNYFGGQTVSVAAIVPTGMVFFAWSGDTEYLADPNSTNTTFLMPERAVAITAIFEVEPYRVSVVNGWDAGSLPNATHEGYGDAQGSYPPGAAVRIVANPAPLWKKFNGWTALPAVTNNDPTAEVTWFVMPSNSVAITANYIDQTAEEKLAGALTIRGQPLMVSAVSTNGVVALSSGGVRYNDPVVKFGGPTVGPSQSVSLTITNFLGDGTLLFWWRGDTEADADGIAVLYNGTNNATPTYSEKVTNTVDSTTWYLNAFTIPSATNITLRYSRDASYMVHENFMLMDRLTWLPKPMKDALEMRTLPNVNQEFDPCFNGHPKQATGLHTFSGEDGGVKWDTTESAIKIGNFGYVTNNQLSQVGFAFNSYSVKPAGGILIWEWKTESESKYDRLELLLNLMPTNWISGKNTGWVTNTFVLKKAYTRPSESPISDTEVTWPVFGFRYTKDYDQSFFEDAGWVRAGKWYPTYDVTVVNGTNTVLTLPNPLLNSNADVLAEIANGVVPAGTEMRIQALVPLGNVFTGWTGNFGGSGLAVGDPDQIITNLEQHISITATYIASTNSPSPSPSPAPQIMNFMISDTPAPSYSGMFAAAPSPDQVPSKTVTMTFEGASLLGVSVEWSPSLAEQNWVKLPITATQELASLPDGRKLWELKASDPSASPQGFFRLRQTN
jgi:hypothetical protein